MKAKPQKKKAAKDARKKAAGKTKTAKAPKRQAKTPAAKAKVAKKTVAKAPVAPIPAKPKKPKAQPKKRKPAVSTLRKRFHKQREALLRKQSDLMQAYTLSKGESQSHQDSGTEDYIDYAVNSYAREFLLSLSELDRKQLLLVEDALRRIDRGEYGDCQQCGEPIAPKRLEVAPWVRHCIRCQELEEKGLLPQSSYAMDEEEDLAESDEEEFEEVVENEPDEPEEEEAEESEEVDSDLGDNDSDLDDEEEPED